MNKRFVIGDIVRVKLEGESKKDVIGKVSGEEKGGLIKVSLYDHMLEEEKEIDLDVRILEKIKNDEKEEVIEKFVDIMYDIEEEEERNRTENKIELIEELENLLINTRKEIKAPGFPTMRSKGELGEKEEAINILLKHLKEEAKLASFNDIVKIVNHKEKTYRYGVVKKAIRRRSETMYEVETIIIGDKIEFKTIRLKDNQIEKMNKKLNICKYNKLKLIIEDINRIDREFYSLIVSRESLTSSIQIISVHSAVKTELINTVKILDNELMFLKKSNDDNYDKALSLMDEIFVI